MLEELLVVAYFVAFESVDYTRAGNPVPLSANVWLVPKSFARVVEINGRADSPVPPVVFYVAVKNSTAGRGLLDKPVLDGSHTNFNISTFLEGPARTGQLVVKIFKFIMQVGYGIFHDFPRETPVEPRHHKIKRVDLFFINQIPVFIPPVMSVSTKITWAHIHILKDSFSRFRNVSDVFIKCIISSRYSKRNVCGFTVSGGLAIAYAKKSAFLIL